MKRLLTIFGILLIYVTGWGQSGTSVIPSVWNVRNGVTTINPIYIDSLNFSGTVTVLGATVFTGTMTITGDVNITGDVDITGALAIDSITDGTASWSGIRHTLFGFDSIKSTVFNDGTLNLTSGKITGLASATDGTAKWYTGALSGFDSISSTLYISDGTWKTVAGRQEGLVRLTDGTGTWYTGSLQGFDTIASTSLLTDGTWKTVAGVQAGLVSLSDGTASWNNIQQLGGFKKVTADTLTDGTATIIGGEMVVTDITVNTPSNIYALSHNSFADYVAEQHFYQVAIDSVNTSFTGILYSTAGVLSTLTEADYVTWADTSTYIATAYDISDMVEFADSSTYMATQYDITNMVEWTSTGDLDITGLIRASDSLCVGSTKVFHFTVFHDTLCSVVGTDTVRQHPPR